LAPLPPGFKLSVGAEDGAELFADGDVSTADTDIMISL
jgi:hypothetical protein